jgi:hypothetical protein
MGSGIRRLIPVRGMGPIHGHFGGPAVSDAGDWTGWLGREMCQCYGRADTYEKVRAISGALKPNSYFQRLPHP